jgi:hypothetical protein
MFSVKFTNGQFLGMSMSEGFIFAANENFRYPFDSIAQIEQTKKYFCDCVGQNSFVIVDKQFNEVQTISL